MGKKIFNIAIVGATGVVGQEVLGLLEKKDFPISDLYCFASKDSEGKIIKFKNQDIKVQVLDKNNLKPFDFIFFCADKKTSKEFAPLFAELGSVVIDNSSAFREDPNVPLVIPEINPHALTTHQGIIASPNCTTTIMLLVAAPLHKEFKIKRLSTTTYQAASGAGQKAMDELLKETEAYIQKKPFQKTVMPYPYAFNLFCHESPMLEDDLVEEEKKVIVETQKILEEKDLAIHATCVRVPILRTHSEALNIQFEKPITKELAYETLSNAKGICLLEDFSKNRFPMPCDAHGEEKVFYGRIRKDLSQKNALDIWVVGDQLLKGSALNAVQIAQEVVHASLYTRNWSCCS